MSRDPIVDEVRANRDAIAREHGNDLETIIAALIRKQRGRKRRVVSLGRRREVGKPVRRKAG